MTPPAAVLAEAPVGRRPGASRHRNYPLTTSRRAAGLRDEQSTRHQRVETGSFVLRPGGPVEERRFPASPGHRPRPVHTRCDNPRVVARRAALRRRHILLAVAAVGLLLLLAGPLAGRGSASRVASGPVPATTALSPHAVYLVQPGDTLWSIAERLVPQGDPRAVVSALAREVGQDTVRPGERLLLP